MSSETEFFDPVIIGSGFGGSVMAYRLAEAGLRVCLLERGKAYPPNSFRVNLMSLANTCGPSSDFYGLFDIWSFKKSGALVSSGLGGRSLIYANLHLRKDPNWLRKIGPLVDTSLAHHLRATRTSLRARRRDDDRPQVPTRTFAYDKTLAMQEANRNIQLGDNSTHTRTYTPGRERGESKTLDFLSGLQLPKRQALRFAGRLIGNAEVNTRPVFLKLALGVCSIAGVSGQRWFRMRYKSTELQPGLLGPNAYCNSSNLSDLSPAWLSKWARAHNPSLFIAYKGEFER